MANDKLSVKERKFIDNLFAGMSQGKAYIEAGYKPSIDGAYSFASRMIRKDKVKREIERRQAEIRAASMNELYVVGQSAVKSLAKMMIQGTKEDRVKLDATKDVLDRLGIKEPEKAELEHSGEVLFKLENINLDKFPKQAEKADEPPEEQVDLSGFPEKDKDDKADELS